MVISIDSWIDRYRPLFIVLCVLLFLTECVYEKGHWSGCVNNEQVKVKTLIASESDLSCKPEKTKTRKC